MQKGVDIRMRAEATSINLVRETKKRGKRRDDGWLLTQLRACDPRPAIFDSRATSRLLPESSDSEGVVAEGIN